MVEPQRLYWKGYNLNFIADESMLVSMVRYREHKDRTRCHLDEANLISSKTDVPGLHMPVLDLDFRHVVGQNNTGWFFAFWPDMPKGSVQMWRLHLLIWTWRHTFGEAAQLSPNGPLTVFLNLPAHQYFPSTTPSRAHLFLDVPLSWRRTVWLLFALRQAGVVERGFLRWSIRRGSSFVRVPGVRKTETEQLRSEIQPAWGFLFKRRIKS